MKELGPCIRHPDEPALFRCRQCHDAVCVGCRAPGERDLCGTCAEYRQESAARDARGLAGEEVDERPRPVPWGRYAIGALVALNIALGSYLVLAVRADGAAARTMQAAATVAKAVDESRDASGRYPTSLTAVLPRLPEPVAEMVRSGVIRYETDPARSDYTVSVVLGRP